MDPTATFDASRLVVAVDGPAGSGKSTVARAVADRLGLRYLDTGSAYRAVTLDLLGRGVPVADPEAVADAIDGVDLGLEPAQDHPQVLEVTLAGTHPGRALRTPSVGAAVSAVSAVAAVRTRVNEILRAAIGHGGVVAEGRDVGTAVWPSAQLKVFLVADQAERGRRRARDADAESPTALARRDDLDAGRQASPTRPAPDAVVLDSTHRSVEQVVAEILALVASTGAAPGKAPAPPTVTSLEGAR